MSRNKILLVAVLMMGLAATVIGDSFMVDLWLDNATGKYLTFGMQENVDEEKALLPLPPFLMGMTKNVYLEGPGSMSKPVIDDDFDDLETYIKESADAGVWKLCVVNKNVDITFKITQALPQGSILKVYAEGDEDNAMNVVDGSVLKATVNTNYLIDYRKTAGTPAAMPCPPVKKLQMNKAANGYVIDFDIPDGFELAADSTVKAFSYNYHEKIINGVDESYWGFDPLDGEYGTFDAATKKLNMTNVTNVDRVQFQYWFTNDAISSDKAVVIVDLTEGLMTSLLTSSVVAVDPSADDYAGTVSTYKIDFDDAAKGQPLTLKLNPIPFTPTSDPYIIEYAFSETADYSGDYSPLPNDENGIVDNDASKSDSVYLQIKVTMTSKSESGTVSPMIVIGNYSVDLTPVQFILLDGNGTMDIDVNGEIIVEDAIMMYNFIALGGVTRPTRVTERQITQGVDTSKVDSAKALEILRSLAPFLDYDENGEIIVEDAIMMYNFIALGGVTRPTRVTERQITQGVDTSKVDAAKALENFRKYVSK